MAEVHPRGYNTREDPMKLVIKKAGQPLNELKFASGPIYIGRHAHSQIFLPASAVSRRHAVIYDAQGKWLVEDLDSANKTYLNDQPIHKADLAGGDVIRIADFTIEVTLSQAAPPPVPAAVQMDETLITVRHDLPTVSRQCQAKEGPEIQLPARRFRDFARAASQICAAENLKQLHRTLLDVLAAQFGSHDAWAALRKMPEGPFEQQGGRRMTTEIIKRSDLVMQQHVADACEKHKCILVPQVPREIAEGQIRSAIIAPILHENHCHGALYADNSRDHEHYTMHDLDYLLFIALQTGAAIQKL